MRGAAQKLRATVNVAEAILVLCRLEWIAQDCLATLRALDFDATTLPIRVILSAHIGLSALAAAVVRGLSSVRPPVFSLKFYAAVAAGQRYHLIRIVSGRVLASHRAPHESTATFDAAEAVLVFRHLIFATLYNHAALFAGYFDFSTLPVVVILAALVVL